MSNRLIVNRSNITEIALDQGASEHLAAGQARLKLQNFALTANNVTYAATGDVIGYWKFFPTGKEGQGIVPVWGTAVVAESQTEVLAAGDRLYGFFPMAEELVIRAEPDQSGMIVDTASHRAELPVVYNHYAMVKNSDPKQDHLRALLQPLLATSHLLFDWLVDNDCFGAEQIVIGSASSKTGLGLCKYLAEPADRNYSIVGLTSEGNKDFVEGLGACDQVLTYDQIEHLTNRPSVYVDMAGNADVKSRLHHHLTDNMRHSSAVGTSHWDKFAPPNDLPGAKPKFFFAPAQIQKRREEWGPGAIEKQITAAWKRLASDSAAWLSVKEHQGLESAIDVYQSLAKGDASPKDGHIINLA